MEELTGSDHCSDAISSSSSEGHLPSYAASPSACFWPASSGETPGESRKVKVELCRNYVENGYCVYADRCCFAHGYQELCRNSALGPKLRTKQCRLFHKELVCKYGNRCNFIHQTRHAISHVQPYCETVNMLNDYPQLLLIRGKPRSILASLIRTDC